METSGPQIDSPSPAPTLPNDLIDSDQAARILGITPATLRRWISEGLLTSWRSGKKHRLSERAVRSLVKPT